VDTGGLSWIKPRNRREMARRASERSWIWSKGPDIARDIVGYRGIKVDIEGLRWI
jgi:hypothetical protein